MPYHLVVVRGRSASQALRLGEGITTVGRQDHCQLRIKSSQVSRQHCQLFEKKGHLIVKDLGSANGTLVNGQKIQGQQVLEAGDELTIGPVRLKVEKVGAAPATPARKPSDTAVAEPVAVSDADFLDEPDTAILDDDDVVEIDIEDEPTATSPKITTTAHQPTPPPASPPKSDQAEAEPIEIGEEAVAEFLLDLDVDEDDK